MDVLTWEEKSALCDCLKRFFAFAFLGFASNNINISRVTKTIKFHQSRMNVDSLIKTS